MDRTLRSFYGFDRIPFGAGADAAPPFLSAFHSSLVQSIVDSVLSGSAVTAVRGGRGVGKTTLTHVVAAGLRKHDMPVVQVAPAQQNPDAVQRLMGEAMGVDGAEARKPDDLILSFPAGRLVLVFDDADTLSSAMYRYLSLLLVATNFAPTKIQLVLFGQLGRWAGVGLPDLETLRLATLAGIVIPPLSTADAVAYLDHKLAGAGRPLRQIMTQAAARDLVEHAQGIPGQLDELTDYALWHGHQNGKRRITRKSLRLALGPGDQAGGCAERTAAPAFKPAAAAAGVAAVAVAAFLWWVAPGPHEARPAVPVAGLLPAPDSTQAAAPAPADGHQVDAPAMPAGQASPPADTAPSAPGETPAALPSPPAVNPPPPTGTADATPPEAPVASPFPAPQPDQTAALPDDTRPGDPAPPPAGTADATPPPAPVAGPVPAPQPDQVAAVPEVPAEAPPPVAAPAPQPDQAAALPDVPADKPADSPSRPADASPAAPQTADASAPTPPPMAPQPTATVPPPVNLGAPGLVLVAAAGDSLPTLYARMYRGVKPPPYAVFLAANRTPVTPGALVVFPEPPGGWSSR
jgi:type II secretory pathway predicted ATPase ExeA